MRGDVDEARREFASEIAAVSGQLYGPEFAMNAHDGAGFASLRHGDAEDAVRQFRRALALFPDHARSLVGLAAALQVAGLEAESETAFARADACIAALRQGGRGSEATLTQALHHAARGEQEAALHQLIELLDHPELPFTGWTIPLEPLLERVRQLKGYRVIGERLAERAG
ncbi:MAG: hypothetical protein ABIX28_19675 [Vicinamibacterales bacterium]